MNILYQKTCDGTHHWISDRGLIAFNGPCHCYIDQLIKAGTLKLEAERDNALALIRESK